MDGAVEEEEDEIQPLPGRVGSSSRSDTPASGVGFDNETDFLERRWTRRSTYTTIKTSPFVAPQSGNIRNVVKVPNVIVMVGLPARGKTYISRKLCRYLNWIGIRTQAFNLGDYRRECYKIVEEGDNEFFNPNNQHGNLVRDRCLAINVGEYRRDAHPVKETDDTFFDPNNTSGVEIRNECARRALRDMCKYLENEEGEVAIFDATNTTCERRQMVLQTCVKKHGFRVFFIESVCNDPKIVDMNIQDVKVNSPDYQDMDNEKARSDFLKRISHYEAQYEPLNDESDVALSYIRVINAGRAFYVNNVEGHVQSRVVYFLMNIHLMPRSIYLTRHGESVYNSLARLGGDSPLSQDGEKYAEEVLCYFKEEKVDDLRVWSSQKLRAVQTAQFLLPIASFVEYWKALEELDAGVCEGLTYEEIAERYPQQLDMRDQDKYHYRYPSGESYEDLVGRIEPVIMELERQANVMVVSHQAVLRCILAYFLDKTNELPYLRVPLHSIIKLTPIAYGCRVETIKFDIDAADTYRAKPREKPAWSVASMRKEDMKLCRSP